MNDYSGIIHRIYEEIIPIFVIGLVMFWIAFHDSPAKKKRYLCIAWIAMVLSVLEGGFYIYKSKYPIVLCHRGYFDRQYSAPRSLSTDAYVFSNEHGRKPIFYLDDASKKKIFEEDLIEGVEYLVFYEKDTKIIVRLEVYNE